MKIRRLLRLFPTLLKEEVIENFIEILEEKWNTALRVVLVGIAFLFFYHLKHLTCIVTTGKLSNLCTLMKNEALKFSRVRPIGIQLSILCEPMISIDIILTKAHRLLPLSPYVDGILVALH